MISVRQILALALCSYAQITWAQDTYVKVKFTEEFTLFLESTAPLQSVNGYVNFNDPELDSLNDFFHVKRMERLFPYAEKFDHRHRSFGLHHWYVLTLQESEFSAMQCVKSYEKCEFVQSAETYQEKYLNDGYEVDQSTLAVADDPSVDKQWHYENKGQSGGTPGADIDLFNAWDIETGDSSVIVAIIDGGLDVNHEDLSANIWVNEVERDGIVRC